MAVLYLSRKNIERIARSVIDEYFALPKIRIQPEIRRIDPFILAENLLGLKVDFRHLSADRQIFGLTSYLPTFTEIINDNNKTELIPLDGETIIIEQDLAFDPMPGKYDFTIVHETSHHILRRLFPSAYGPQTMSYSKVHYYRAETKKDVTDWEEWQANTLASAVLMPIDLIKRNMVDVGLGEKLSILNRKYRREDYMKFVKLANTMGVSLQALRIRMNQLDLLGNDQYYSPNRFFDIEAY